MQFVDNVDPGQYVQTNLGIFCLSTYKGESINNQPNLFPVEIQLFFFDVIAL